MLHVPSSSKVCIEMYVSMPAYDIYAGIPKVYAYRKVFMHTHIHTYVHYIYVPYLRYILSYLRRHMYVVLMLLSFFFFFFLIIFNK